MSEPQCQKTYLRTRTPSEDQNAQFDQNPTCANFEKSVMQFIHADNETPISLPGMAG